MSTPRGLLVAHPSRGLVRWMVRSSRVVVPVLRGLVWLALLSVVALLTLWVPVLGVIALYVLGVAWWSGNLWSGLCAGGIMTVVGFAGLGLISGLLGALGALASVLGSPMGLVVIVLVSLTIGVGGATTARARSASKGPQ